MHRGETVRHRRLKELALAWARAAGLTLAAAEVRVPRSGCRADVAAAAPGPDGACALLECKQARADLRRDAHGEAETRARAAALAERRRTLESLLALHRPDLRRGEALWPEYDTWDFSTLRHRGRRALLRALAAAERQRRDGTKFARLRRYHAADHLYLVVEPDTFARADLPPGWGLLVRRPAAGGAPEGLELVRPADALAPAPAAREALRAAIRAAARPRPAPAGALLCG